MENLVTQLKNLNRIEPREDWVKSNKELLLSQIKAQAPESRSSFFSFWYFGKMLLPQGFITFIAKPIGVISVIMLMIFGSGAFTVNASKNSLPGDILYSIKLTSEKVMIGLTVSDEKKTERNMTIADNRMRELETIVASDKNNDTKKQQIMVVTENLIGTMNGINKNIEDVSSKKEDLSQRMEIVQRVDERATQIVEKLDKSNEVFIDNDVTENISQVTKVVEDTSLKAVQTIAEKYDNGEIDISSEKVVEVIENQIKKVEQKIAEIAPENLGQNENEVGAKSIADHESAQLGIAEATVLLNQGDVLSAIEKMKEVSELVEKTNEIVVPDQIVGEKVNLTVTEEEANAVVEDNVVEDNSLENK
ncbi:hypothetical protein A2533_03230 [Candidatus Falkowbacteria bacterium RIFOXYD2_FULL_35_9]|uniref:DUF5667 domain-containing protein n=1 Tax=Candidatus Falkowbacteria bacterium RIFOXYC2_FULL_36_12 TaxID=1798002 RepID=A0A1F5SVX8_9BACT|nr:MAG: hypothetical protein A2300_00695 [Candidatus Falkowbacteria bacterium RIFOXYB2_FULL_35_7]OGF30860.1 MAG: hypothetical protein A2478_00190 [Candidatus Falkowbacteria bacterium RIFOXYC2_FULL_36_12]OGF34239.1 MAG: hypothetical protein A2223_04550 [Candidatus Falkowbacteria bacterium RIFOXYA2_FULL_35_8]OGF48219.1 MAG: hypothetical protein A2533_03230 [Candidatus Falkowbacteria bacterium RIFOXYD2_FULL_35_9]